MDIFYWIVLNYKIIKMVFYFDTPSFYTLEGHILQHRKASSVPISIPLSNGDGGMKLKKATLVTMFSYFITIFVILSRIV